MIWPLPNWHTIALSAKEHAAACFPNESVGAVTASGYLPLINAAPGLDQFECTAQLLDLEDQTEVLALIHSHPDGPEFPSIADINQQRAMGIPWGIVAMDGGEAEEPYLWGDDLPIPPLEGRPFRWGPSGTDGRGDCGALVRDYFRLKGWWVPDTARERHWARHGLNYGEVMLRSGFKRSEEFQADPMEGDVVLFRVRATEPNHAGIWLPGGIILHHLEGRLSCKQPLVGFARLIDGWFRHERVVASATPP